MRSGGCFGAGPLCGAVCTAAALLSSCAAPPPAAPPPAGLKFREAAAALGVDFRHVNGASPEKLFPETMGAGAAVLDYNRDGHPDLLFTNGHPLRGRPPASRPGPRLYRGTGPGFVEVTDDAGLRLRLYGMGVAVADYNGDGWPDVYLSAVVGPGRLLRNDQGRFRDVTARAGVGCAGLWGTGCTWLDYDRDGRLDLYVAAYVRYRTLADDQPCFVRPGRRSYCIPPAYSGSSGRLFRSLGDDRFADVTRAAGLLDTSQKALGVTACDLNDDGWADLLVANDTVPNRLFLNRGGRFEEAAATAGVAWGPRGRARAGMGVDVADFRNDGTQAAAITHFSGEGMGLFVTPRPGLLLYGDESEPLGVHAATAPRLGFGVRFEDFDNDGYQDLAAVHGHVRDDVAELEPGALYAQPAVLLHSERGRRFADVTAGTALAVAAVRRGLASADLNDDGRMDLVATVNGGPAEIWLNETPAAGHWLRVTLSPAPGKPEPIGARVRVLAGGKAWTRWLRGGGSYLCESDHRLHFGLGSAGRYESLQVRWPGGHLQELPGGFADREVTLREAAP